MEYEEDGKTVVVYNQNVSDKLYWKSFKKKNLSEDAVRWT